MDYVGMNAGFGPDLGITSYSGPERRYYSRSSEPGTRGSHVSSNGSYHDVPIRPHPSHYRPRPPQSGPAPVGTIATGRGKWMIPLCYEPENDMNTCCLGFWCPQILYGRTQFRIRQINRNKDPLDLSEYECINGPCGIFMFVGYTAQFSWLFIVMQHARIREMYDIEGAATSDCCAACVCPCCTLMQDDREIRARQYKNEKDEKGNGTIKKQPSHRPSMQYASLNLPVDEKSQQHRSLDSEKLAIAAGMAEDHDPELAEQQSKPKKLNMVPEIDANKSEQMGDGKTLQSTHFRDEAGNVSLFPKISTSSIQGPENATTASTQRWRNQVLAEKPKAHHENESSASPIDGAKGSENHDPVKNHHRTFDYFEDASLSQIRGRRVLRQLNEAIANSTQLKTSSQSESLRDETVLVFYEDGEIPQRHSIADCARLRASTIDRTDTPRHNDLPPCWHVEEDASEHDQQESSNVQNLAGCPTVIVTEDPKPLDHQHILNDCEVENKISVRDIQHKHQSTLHTLDTCAGDSGSDENNTTTREVPNHGPVNQHALKDCATEVIVHLTYPDSADEIPQHILEECFKDDTNPAIIVSTPLDQQDGIKVSTTDDVQAVELPFLEQHTLTDCVTDVDGAQADACNNTFSENGRQRLKSPAGQSRSHSITITVPQQPVIIVTTPELLEDAAGARHPEGRSNSPEIIVISNDSEVSTKRHGGLSGPTNDHDGATDVKDGQGQLGHAAAALRKVLRAAADIRHGRITKEDDPRGLQVYNAPKRTSSRSSNRVIEGRM